MTDLFVTDMFPRMTFQMFRCWQKIQWIGRNVISVYDAVKFVREKKCMVSGLLKTFSTEDW